jgi:hypothetical protein
VRDKHDKEHKAGVCTLEGDEHDQEHKGGGEGGMEGVSIRGDDKRDKNTRKGNDYYQ